MALSVKKGTFTLPTTTQSVPVTGVGFQPKALILWTSGRTATGFAAEMRMSFGFGASSSQRGTVAVRGQDAGTSTGRNPSTTRILIPSVTVAGVIEMQLDLTSLDSDGFTLALTVSSAGTAYVVHYLALGGADLTNAFAGTATPSAGTGNKSVTGVGFQPDCLLLVTANDPPAGGSDTGASFGIGAATATQECANHMRSRNAANPTQDSNYQRSDKFFVTYQTGSDAIDSEATLGTMDSDGFTINYTTHADATVGFSYLALKGGQYHVHAETQKTSTGTKAKTGVGFAPTGLLSFGVNAVANSSPILTQAKMSIGGTDGSTEGSGWCASTDNVATADRNSHHSTTKFMTHASNTSTVDAECDSTLDADGYTLDWTTADATAREMLMVAFGSTASGAVFNQSLSATATVTATILNSVGKRLTPTVTSTASILKSIGKRLTPTVTTTATVRKSMSKALTGNATSTATIRKSMGKPMTANATVTATMTKSIAKRLTATVTTTATIVAVRALLLSMTATVTSTATIATLVVAAVVAIPQIGRRLRRRNRGPLY